LSLGIELDLRDAIEHRSLEVELHHHTNRFGETWVQGHGKVKGAYLARLDQLREGWQGTPVLAVNVKRTFCPPKECYDPKLNGLKAALSAGEHGSGFQFSQFAGLVMMIAFGYAMTLSLATIVIVWFGNIV